MDEQLSEGGGAVRLDGGGGVLLRGLERLLDGLDGVLAGDVLVPVLLVTGGGPGAKRDETLEGGEGVFLALRLRQAVGGKGEAADLAHELVFLAERGEWDVGGERHDVLTDALGDEPRVRGGGCVPRSL